MDGICLGDVRFAKIQTTIRMRTVSIPTLERWIKGRKFNPNCKAEHEYSRSTGILVILNPDNQGTGLKCVSVRLIVRWHNGNVRRIDDILKLIAHAHSQLHESKSPQLFCIIVGDYGGCMGFATDPPFCTAYPLSFANKDDLAQMTFRNPQNQPASFRTDVLLVCQLLTRDCSARKYVENRNNRHLIIPRGLHFSIELFPQIVIPRNHIAPYRDPRTGVEAPFFTVGPFASSDTLFPGTAGDLDLFTDGEVYALRHIGALKSPITVTSNPHASTPASRVEPDSSTRKCSRRDSLRHRRPVSSAAGSAEDLGKLEYECSTDPKRITGDGRGVAFKRGLSVDRGFSGERPHPKEQWTERDRSRGRMRGPSHMPERPQCRPFLLAPGAPSRPTTGSPHALRFQVQMKDPFLSEGVET